MNQLNAVLILTGNSEQVLNFYRDALGGTVEIQRYKDAPPESGQQTDPTWGDKVMYGTLTSPFGIIAAMDATPDRAGKPGDNFGVSVAGDDDSAMSKVFTKLSSGGEVRMPYGPTFWAAKFGMCKDKYGTLWMVNCQLAPVGSHS